MQDSFSDIGLSQLIELPNGGLLLIEGELRDVQEWRRPRIFDPLKGVSI